jgi:hypothetical protein
MWPWVVGIFGVLFLVLIGISVAAVLLIPRVVRRQPVIVSKANDNNDTNANTGANNTNSSNHDSESNSNSGPAVNTPPPTDKDLGDDSVDESRAGMDSSEHKCRTRRSCRRFLADDYVGPDGTGKMQGKAEYINNIQRDESIQKWEFDDLHLVQRGDRATLTGKIHFQIEDKEVVYDFVDRFVWRDGRWQATGSDVTPNQ